MLDMLSTHNSPPVPAGRCWVRDSESRWNSSAFLNHVVKFSSLWSPAPITGHLLYIGLVPRIIECRKNDQLLALTMALNKGVENKKE